MIDVVIVDDHAAVRAGLVALLRAEPGFRVRGTAPDRATALRELGVVRPDCVMLDYHLGEDDGLGLCREISRQPGAPAIVIYSAYGEPRLALAAAAAGASALLDKGGQINEMFDTLRLATRGYRLVDRPPARTLMEFAPGLTPEESQLASLLIAGSTTAEIASAIDADEDEVEVRADAIINLLRPPTALPVS